MPDTNRDKIIEKIRKLLALSADTPAAAEAAAAALKAQRLIARHDVTDTELSQGDLGEVTEVETGRSDNERWRAWLAVAIAENFRCKTYCKVGGGGRVDVFVGHELDARAATLTHEHLAKIALCLARRHERRHRATFGTASGVRLAYMMGFVAGIREELEKGTMALMLVRQPDVDEYFDELQSRFVKPRARRTVYAPHGAVAIADAGRVDGRDAVRRTRIGGQAALATGHGAR